MTTGEDRRVVVTRFPPEPSGFLHVGHAKAALLNRHFADLHEGGSMLVRFDDTNPSNGSDEFVRSILKDVGDLGIEYARVTYASDYFAQMLLLGERLVEAGVLYADDTAAEAMREERLARVESRCRGRSARESLGIFREMQAGSAVGLANCLRFRFDMTDPNGCMRDPVAFRCSLARHWRTGRAYNVYPTYDFACPFVDALEGVTHALRTSEYKDRDPQFQRVLGEQRRAWRPVALLPHVDVGDYSRLNLEHTVLSKRKLAWLVENGKVGGWDDPRMPTVRGVLRRGMTVRALREFILAQGASKNVTVQEWGKLWSINKRLIDPVCPRHTAVAVAGRVPVTLLADGSPAADYEEVVAAPRHRKYPPAGQKSVVRSSALWMEQADAAALQPGEEFTLMGWGNAVVRGVTRCGAVVVALEAELRLEGDVRRTERKVTWLSRRPIDQPSLRLVDLTLVDFGHLITKRRLDKGDDFVDFLGRDSWMETAAVGDGDMRRLAKGDVLQLERKGYFIVDRALPPAGDDGSMVLFSIPDGRRQCRPPCPSPTAPAGESSALDVHGP